MTARALTAYVLLLFASCSGASPLSPLTVPDAIQTARLLAGADRQSVFPSPDGMRYVVAVVRGDVARDGVWVELLSGELVNIERSQPRMVARLFTSGLGSAGVTSGRTELTMPGKNYPRWIDNESVAIRWEDEQGKIQVVSVNSQTGALRYLTESAEDVTSFSAGPGGVLLYEARIRGRPEESEQLMRNGFVVTSPDVMSLLGGIVDGSDSLDERNFQRYVATVADPSSRHRPVMGGVTNVYSSILGATQHLSSSRFSPNGAWAIVDGSPERVPKRWWRYEDASLKKALLAYATDPKDLGARQIQQLFLLDVSRAIVTPLLDAPTSPRNRLKTLAWSPCGKSVLLGPVLLPLDADPGDVRLHELVEVEIPTKRVTRIPIDGHGDTPSAVQWLPDSLIEVRYPEEPALYLRRTSQGWQSIRGATAARKALQPPPSVRVEVRQRFDVAPQLYAVDSVSHRERMVYDLNPQIQRRFKLGRVSFIHWKDPSGEPRTARLYYPVNFRDGSRYPLVVQTNGYATEQEYSIYGPGGDVGLGPGVLPINIAQLLANQDIAVLQISGAGLVGVGNDDASFATRWAAGLESAIASLVEDGLVDPRRVGLAAFSITGRYVEHALTFSDFPYAAAVISDHADVNYIQAASYGWRKWYNDWNGAPPFGEGLTEWIENSPSFNVHRIQTPIQYSITSASPGFANLLWPWEMFSRLRALGRPVEYYVAPDIRRGSHNLQNPRQLLTLQQRVLDWWCFWLKDEQDSDRDKVQQYASWRELRQLHRTGARSQGLENKP